MFAVWVGRIGRNCSVTGHRGARWREMHVSQASMQLGDMVHKYNNVGHKLSLAGEHLFNTYINLGASLEANM